MQIKILSMTMLASVSLVGCATIGEISAQPEMVAAADVNAPEPIEDNSGEYMSPYTSDDVLAEWVDSAVKARAGAAMGGAIGEVSAQYASEKLLEGFGMFGSMLGKSAGKSIGREAAIRSAGGMEMIIDSSDLSFNSWTDLSVYLYAEHSHRENFPEVLEATSAIYTELADGGYETAIAQYGTGL